MHLALPLLATLGNSRKNFIKHEISKGELIFLWETKPREILIIPIINYLHLMNTRLLFLLVERAHWALMEFFIPCSVISILLLLLFFLIYIDCYLSEEPSRQYGE